MRLLFKNLYFLTTFLLLISVICTACDGGSSNTSNDNGNNRNIGISDAEAVSQDKANLVITFTGSDTPEGITQKITLPANGANGTSITWSSGNTSVIAIDGTVSRPAFFTGNIAVILSANITKNNISDNKEFTLTVLRKPLTNPATDPVNPGNSDGNVHTPSVSELNWQMIGSGLSTGAVNNVTMGSDMSGNLFVAYSDESDSNSLYINKWNGTSWITVGSGSVASNVYQPSIAVTPDGTPYVAYQTAAIGEVHVWRFNGTSWIDLSGTLPSTVTRAHGTRLAVGRYIIGGITTYVPYVALVDQTPGDYPKVFRLEAAWTQVGTAVNSTNTSELSIAFDLTGATLLAYKCSNSANVKRYNGINWEQVGSADFAPNTAYSLSLAVDSFNTPFIGYVDFDGVSILHRASVMKYDGTAWQFVGSRGFSAGTAQLVNMALDSNATPFIAYQDAAAATRLSVMKWNSASWVYAGKQGFTEGSASNLAFADCGGYLYVAYRDSAHAEKLTLMKYRIE
jgi:hypothetical protein